MLELPQITLIALTGKDFPSHDEAIKKSCEGIEWGAVKVIYDYKINSIDAWNKAIVYELHNYVQTPYCMLVHGDGFVVRPDLWREEWLNYSYIGAPWPLPRDSYSYRDPEGNLIRVGNSVSLRSQSLLRLPSELGLPWREYYGNTNEDGFICVHNRKILEENGVRFAEIEEARFFSKEHSIPENEGIDTFAFHSL